MSLVKNLIAQVQQIWSRHPGTHVSKIEVEIGPLSGVEPLLLASAFDQIACSVFRHAIELELNEVTLLAMCQDCNREFDVNDFDFRCTHCRGVRLKISRGDSVVLSSLTFDPIASLEIKALT